MYKKYYHNSVIGTVRFDKGFLDSSQIIAELIAKNPQKFICQILNPDLTEAQKIIKLNQSFKDSLIEEGEKHV